MLDKDIILSLRDFNSRIKSNSNSIPAGEKIRHVLEDVGQFKQGQKIPVNKVSEYCTNKPLIAVDGSRLEYGSFFPYNFVFMRTLAKDTDGNEIWKGNLITPLNPAQLSELKEMAQKEAMGLEESYHKYLKEKLAHMEINTAIEAICSHKPYMLILDGGFLLFDRFTEWNNLREMCVKNNILLVGVIEEVATAELARWLNLQVADRPRIYDREILFGLLKPGEYLHFYPENRVKKDYCTVFARLSSSPQAIGCDFLPEQEERVKEAMNFLYTLAPEHGQGIPAWLQIVDAEVRLRRSEMDRVVNMCIDHDIYERYFKPNRDKRSY